MQKKVMVISLGGSVILSEQKKDNFLLDLREVLRKQYKHYKFVLVCGGGSIARQYQNVLRKEHKSNYELAKAGIRSTRMNAEFIMQVFGKEANETLPYSMKEVKTHLAKKNIAVCGSLRYASEETSDSTAVKLAHYLKATFINITNVAGLYTADPRTSKKAKLIPYQTWTEFEERALKIAFHPGQHFVLDQKAARLIHANKIPTFIVGKDVQNINKLLSSKSFVGTTIGP